jgi:hypothetical protein
MFFILNDYGDKIRTETFTYSVPKFLLDTINDQGVRVSIRRILKIARRGLYAEARETSFYLHQ